MPQLSIETFVSQYFWLILIFLVFYYVVITQVLPNIAKILKARNKVEAVAPGIESTKVKDEIKISLKSYKTGYISDFVGSEIEKAKINWINKNVRSSKK